MWCGKSIPHSPEYPPSLGSPVYFPPQTLTPSDNHTKKRRENVRLTYTFVPRWASSNTLPRDQGLSKCSQGPRSPGDPPRLRSLQLPPLRSAEGSFFYRPDGFGFVFFFTFSFPAAANLPPGFGSRAYPSTALGREPKQHLPEPPPPGQPHVRSSTGSPPQKGHVVTNQKRF